MTLVHISYEHPDGIGLTPSEGYLEWFPTKRRNDAATVILPESFTTVLAAGITTVEIAPTEPSWAWVVYERVPGGSSRCVAVADVTEVNYTDLIDVDPGTLTPTAAPEAAWWAAIGASVQGAAVVGSDLIFTRRDGTTFDAGQVGGTAGTDASALVTGTLDDARLPTTAQAATLAATYETQTASAAALSGHTSNVSNPHSVTKAQVGLGSADNTSDADKPVSTAQASALALKANAADTETALGLKAPLDSPAFTGTVTGVTKANVGLGSVDNTSDALKPLSDAATTALGAKQDKATLDADVATDAGTAGTALNTALTADFAPITGSANYSGSPAGTAGKPLAATDATTTNARTPTAHKTSHGLGGTDPVLLDATQVTTGTLDDARLPTTAQAVTLAATYAPITGSANYLAPTALDAAQAANINTPASASASALNAGWATTGANLALTANVPHRMTYLAREDKLAGWRAALAKCATSPANVLVFGDSISEGTGSSNVTNAWIQLLQTKLRYNAAQVGGAAWPFIPTMPVTPAPGFPVSVSGTITRQNSWGLGWKTGSVTTTGTITYSFTGTSFKIMYFKGSTSGTMSIVVDGGAAVTVDTNSTTNGPGANASVYSSGALARAAHTVAITSTSSSAVYPGGILTWDGDEAAGIRLHNAAYHGLASDFFTSPRNDHAADSLIAVGNVGLVLINVGTNDLGALRTPATYATNMQSFITDLRGRGGYKGTIVLMNAYMGGGRLNSDWEPYGQQLDTIAAGDPNIAYYDWRLRMPDDQNPVTLPAALGLFNDTLHPNDAGQAWIASMLADYLSLRSVPTVTTTKTASYTILPTDPTAFWVFNGSSITATIPDPTLVPTGARYTVKNINSTLLTVNSSGTSKTLDGAASQTLAQWAKANYISDGTQWLTI